MSIRETIETWKDSDEGLLTELNRPKNKTVVNDGLVTLAMVSEVSEPLAGLLAVTMKRVIANLKETVDQLPAGDQLDEVEGQHEIFDSFFKRLKESSYGAPIDSDSFRSQFSAVATSAKWTAEQIEAFLSLGAVVTSDAFDELGRDATADDVAEYRREKASVLLLERYDGLYTKHVDMPMTAGDKVATAAGLRLMADEIEVE